MDWYRIYHGLPFDPRLPVVARNAGLTRAETIALWITLHDHASRQTPRGSLAGLDAEETALLLEMNADKTAAALDAFYAKGMIDIENNLSDWARLQYRSTDRVRAYRSRKREAEQNTIPTDTQKPEINPAAATDPDDAQNIAARRARLQQQAQKQKSLRHPQRSTPKDD